MGHGYGQHATEQMRDKPGRRPTLMWEPLECWPARVRSRVDLHSEQARWPTSAPLAGLPSSLHHCIWGHKSHETDMLTDLFKSHILCLPGRSPRPRHQAMWRPALARPDQGRQKTHFPDPGGPSSSVNTPGRMMPLTRSMIAKSVLRDPLPTVRMRGCSSGHSRACS
jgi:hypothetical protein